MAGLRPIKFRLLELFSDEKEHWNYEIVVQMQKEYNMNSNFGRDSINFDILELASGGMLRSVQSKVDEDHSTKTVKVSYTLPSSNTDKWEGFIPADIAETKCDTCESKY